MADGMDRVAKGLRRSVKKADIKDPPKKQVGPAEDRVHKSRLRSKTAAGSTATNNTAPLEGKSGSTRSSVNSTLGKSQKGYLNRVKHARTADNAARKAGSTGAKVASTAKKVGAMAARAAPHPALKAAGGLAYAAAVAHEAGSGPSKKPNTRGQINRRTKRK